VRESHTEKLIPTRETLEFVVPVVAIDASTNPVKEKIYELRENRSGRSFTGCLPPQNCEGLLSQENDFKSISTLIVLNMIDINNLPARPI